MPNSLIVLIVCIPGVGITEMIILKTALFSDLSPIHQSELGSRFVQIANKPWV